MTAPSSPLRILALPLLALAMTGCASSGSPPGSVSRIWTVTEALADETELTASVAKVSVLSTREEAALADHARDVGEAMLIERGLTLEETAPVQWRFVWTRADPIGAGDAPRDPRTLRGWPSTWDVDLATRVRRESWRRPPGSGSSLQLEVLKHGVATWTGAARWEGAVDPEAMDVAVRFLVEQLPAAESGPGTFARLAPGEVLSYYREQCEGASFRAPRLPYPVSFEPLELAYHRGGGDVEWEDTVTRYRHADPSVLPAVRHLVRAAREPVPDGRRSRPQPNDPDLWRTVLLAAPYVDEAGATVHVYARLKGDSRGYRVDETGILDRAGWEAYRADRERHRAELADYYGAR